MVEIKSYLQDGANYQAQAVLALMRYRDVVVRGYAEDIAKSLSGKAYENFKETANQTHIEVGRFENCREQGYVFTLYIGYNQDKHYAVYEHRNSDNLIVLCPLKKTICLNTPTIRQMWTDENRGKNDYNKRFSPEDVVACADYICEDMKKQIDRYVEFLGELDEFDENAKKQGVDMAKRKALFNKFEEYPIELK